MTHQLNYTPRKFAINTDTGNIAILETDHNAYTEETKKQRKIQMAEEMKDAAGEEEIELAEEMAQAFLNENLDETAFGAPKAGAGMWASQIRLIDPITGNTYQVVRMEQNEAAVSVAFVQFASHPNQTFLLVGVAKDYQLNPRVVAGGFVYTYRYVTNVEHKL